MSMATIGMSLLIEILMDGENGLMQSISKVREGIFRLTILIYY